MESSSSFLFSSIVNSKSFNKVNDTFLNSNWFILSLRGLGSFSCDIKANGLFDFVLVVKTCSCSVSFEEVEVPSFGLVISGFDADVKAAKEFYKIYNEIFC